MSRLIVRLLLPVIIVVVALSARPELDAQSSPTGTVGGQISVIGGSLAGARVAISSTGDANFTATATTDSDGKFSIQGVPVGTIGINIFDTQNNLLKTISATLASAGQVLNLQIQVP